MYVLSRSNIVPIIVVCIHSLMSALCNSNTTVMIPSPAKTSSRNYVNI